MTSIIPLSLMHPSYMLFKLAVGFERKLTFLTWVVSLRLVDCFVSVQGAGTGKTCKSNRTLLGYWIFLIFNTNRFENQLQTVDGYLCNNNYVNNYEILCLREKQYKHIDKVSQEPHIPPADAFYPMYKITNQKHEVKMITEP